jgi:hypothetical protein
MTEPAYADGTPMPRCEYCGEFFAGYTGNQVCADCHDHIVEMEKTIARQRADIEALVAYVWQVDRAEDIVGNEAEILRCRAAIEPIIRRWVGGDD